MNRHRQPLRSGFLQRGYTLIEVLVAFAILALALTILLGTLSGATRQVKWADEAGRAALHAQSLLASVGVAESLQPGRRAGTFEDAAAPRLLQLSLQVQWGDGDDPARILELHSLRFVRPDPFDRFDGGAP